MQPRAQAERDVERSGDRHGGRLNARDALLGVERHQATAHVDGGGGQHVAVAQQAELGGTTAQIDVKQCVAALMRQRHRA